MVQNTETMNYVTDDFTVNCLNKENDVMHNIIMLYTWRRQQSCNTAVRLACTEHNVI